jgi:hypothetical protein
MAHQTINASRFPEKSDCVDLGRIQSPAKFSDQSPVVPPAFPSEIAKPNGVVFLRLCVENPTLEKRIPRKDAGSWKTQTHPWTILSVIDA